LEIFFSYFWYSIFAVENFLAKHYSSQVGLEGYKIVKFLTTTYKNLPKRRGWALWQRLLPKTRRTKTRASTPRKEGTESTYTER
jgi:hypothetical protein